MNWKTEAVEKLRRYEAMRQAVINLPEEIKRLESVATGLRSTMRDTTPVRTSGDGREEMFLSNLVHRQELQRSWEQAQSWVRTVSSGLNVLTPEEREILQQLYICPEKNAVQQLSQSLGVEHSSIYRRRDRALFKFTMALYGSMEA